MRRWLKSSAAIQLLAFECSSTQTSNGCFPATVLIASRFLKKKNASVSPRLKTFAISVPRNGHPGTPALYVTQDLKFKLKNTVPEFAGDGTVRYGRYLLAAASVVGYVFMETTAGQGDR
ncbi:uncharacterized protein LOC120427096 [Culex pipiens pallens]|uniref:uncharacterized protein LOC120427096 n=1 Tax=Culex pipiens pallens TaxID=42434 RepID=UPI0022AB0115|nr:uncharacterized protein LOC120427096 [Culex pipiens pallens]